MTTRPVATFTATASNVPDLQAAAETIARAAGIDLDTHAVQRTGPARPETYIDTTNLVDPPVRTIAAWEAEYAVYAQEDQ